MSAQGVSVQKASAESTPAPLGSTTRELHSQPDGTWPHALSHEPMLRVSDVLALVQPEFPALTTSKLRFLDSHGLVCPFRTPSGYRQYSPADIERLRFVLRQQRDHYRPLTVIANLLGDLDSGRLHEPVEPHAIAGQENAFVSAEELARIAGSSVEFVEELLHVGVVTHTVPEKFPREHVTIVVAAEAYVRAGGDVRAIRTLRNAALREVDHARNAAAPARARREHGESHAVATELSEAAISLFSACVRGELNSQ